MALNNLSSMARIDRLALAIGEERFAQVLFEIVRTLSACRQCLVFAFDVGVAPLCLINVGEMPPDRARLFASRYIHGRYALDPVFPRILAQKEDDPPLWIHDRGPRSSIFDSELLEPFQVTDLMGFVTAQGTARFYVMLVKDDFGPFTASQEWLFSHSVGLLAANICKHFSHLRENYGKHAFQLQRVLSGGEIFSAITEREKSVCRGILTGLTSEGIAQDLKISVNSVLTYRKRIYDKLRISSQNELFDLVLQAAVSGDESDRLADLAESLIGSAPAPAGQAGNGHASS